VDLGAILPWNVATRPVALAPAAIALVPSPNLGERPRRWLVVSRHEGSQEYALPGGIIEAGESPERAMIREVAEETGVRVRSYERLGIGTQDGRAVHVFVARAVSGVARPLERDGRGGGEVSYLTWRALRAQARMFGAFLDGVSASFRGTYAENP
jgi:8-oxo-dGTP pyrophosphatase MutT (NUDIX family)